MHFDFAQYEVNFLLRNKQKGFAPIIILIGILVLASVGGAYYFFKVKTPVQRACTMDAKICPDGSSVGRVGPNCEFAPCPKSTTSPSPADETANWKTYTNTKYGFSIKYPPLLNPKETQRDDTFLYRVIFGDQNDKDSFSVEIRNSTLEEEVQYQKWTIEGHVLAKLTREEKITIAGFPAVLLEYTPDRPDIGSTKSFAIVNNSKYSYTIITKPQVVDKILSIFKFLDQSQNSYCNSQSLGGSFVRIYDCGSFQVLVRPCCDFPDVIVDRNGNKIAECGGLAGWSKECQEKFPHSNCSEVVCVNQ